MNIFYRKNRYITGREIDPDEILLDSSNLPNFDTAQFEGRIEKPIGKGVFTILGGIVGFIFFIFAWKIADLQIVQGSAFKEQAEDNRLRSVPIFASRGVIYDRNGIELAWNDHDQEDEFPRRAYTEKDGFGHVLGYVKMPQKDAAGFYYRESYEGEEGVERFYDEDLSGENGMRLSEIDARGAIISENIVDPAHDGLPLTLAIDARIQEKLYAVIKDLAGQIPFRGGAGIIMDAKTGEIIAMTSFPEYDPNMFTKKTDTEEIRKTLNNSATPLLNRATNGLYAPGSVVKPIVALGALNEHVIDPKKQILSTGSLEVVSPYDRTKKTIFRDWKAHGLVDMERALAVSSNVYFFTIAGGFGEQKGLGITKLESYFRLFGLGALTGVDLPSEEDGFIPTPRWKKEKYGDEWRLGDTYNTGIGQYGVQATPLQIVRLAAAISQDGRFVRPHIARALGNGKGRRLVVAEEEQLPIPGEYFSVVKNGMRKVVVEGTGSALNVPFVTVAAKSGTAEIGASKAHVNSWIMGFFPYENPRYAFAVVMEYGSRANLVGGSYVMRQTLDFMAQETPEYFVNNPAVSRR